jgi:hypothetical protein
VCGKPATAWLVPGGAGPILEGSMAHGFANVNGQIVLLCENCFNTEEKTSGAIIRKYLNAPNMEISEGGTYEDIDEIREIADAIKERDDKPTN